jgi:RNA polymerase sigma-70 factor (ECF subfamily)
MAITRPERAQGSSNVVPAHSSPVFHESEARLVARAQTGDASAFHELAEQERPRLRRVLNRITRDCDSADDAVQEALVKAWQNIRQFEGRARFSTWLTSIGIREAYRLMRHARHETLDMHDSVGERIPDWGNRPDEAFESREFLAAIDEALGELPTDYRTAVVLRDVEGLSTRETAEVLGIGERALKSRLHRGRMALRAQLDHYFVGAD